MLFPTVSFAVFFTGVFALSWAMRARVEGRKAFLLVASYVFYGWWDWRFCFLLAFASLVAWASGLLLVQDKCKSGVEKRTGKLILAIAVTVLLGILAFFKYYGFFLDSLQDLLFALNLQRDLPFLQIVLPVGISFFTFQAISYVVDVWRGQVTARRSPLDVMLYISFFPQLVAGPIVRAADFLPQLEKPAQLARPMVTVGLMLCLFGLFKKMVVANYLATDLVDPVFLDPADHSSLDVLMAVYGYAVQIYCDFSGYSDIAIGTALLLGYRFAENFNQPYRAVRLQDFWRRWHISLSGWLRDYFYIPLGGSRPTKKRGSRFGALLTYRNLLLTMVLGGLWHGAAWTFLLWGTIHGAWLALERLAGLNENKSTGGAIAGWFITFHLVCLAWVFFRAENMDGALTMLATFAAFEAGPSILTWFALALIFTSLAFQFGPARLPNRTGAMLGTMPLWITGLIFISGLLLTLWLAPGGTAPFIYFQF
ncbi:MAG: MBOAT family protein [Pseudomonadota bacterium]